MDWNELKKYRPIPKGGLKVAALVVIDLMVGFGVAALIAFFYKWFELVGFWVCGSTVSSFMLVADIFAAHDKLFSGFWRRNVRGYTLWGWRDENDRVRWELALVLPYDLAIGVALGGWFRRSRIICSAVTFREGVNSKEMLSKWRVKVAQIHVCTRTIIVRLTDRCGDRVTVNAKDALEILERFSARLEAIGNGWQDVVRHGLIYERVRTTERDEAVRQRDHAFLAMLKADAAIKGTSRFQKSKDAKRIREGLIRDILEIAPADHPLQRVLREEQSGNQPATATAAAPAATEAREGG